MSEISVKLNQYEMIEAGNIGMLRRILSLNKLNDRMHSPYSNPWQIDMEGAMAEMAYAKAMGVYWPAGVGTFKAPDVGSVQVRATERHDNSLIIRSNDKDEDVYVLVTGSAPQYNIVGWIRGADGKNPSFVKTPNGGAPAYFVPQSKLRSMNELGGIYAPVAQKP